MRKNSFVYTAMLIFALASETVFAAPLIYHGMNPDISPSASPLNEPSIAAQSALTRPKQKTATATGQTDAQLLRSGVLASVSSSITQQLIGTTHDHGVVNFGDGSTATWTTSAGNVRTIVITNLDGTSTTISFPL